ncbi:hypothetical protein J3B02_004724, partial [Coemansia erecta]
SRDQMPSTASDPTNSNWTGDSYNESWVIRMDDLVDRNAVTRHPQGGYQITPENLSTGRSSITIGAAVGGDKRRFNLKWLYEYPWLRFEPQINAMLCALCKECRRANQFAKRGSRNFKTSALVDHSSSNDHQKSIKGLGEPSRDLLQGDPSGAGVALVLEDGMWQARLLKEDKREDAGLSTAATEDHKKNKQKEDSVVAGDAISSSNGAPEKVVDRRMVAQQSASVDSYITSDSITT